MTAISASAVKELRDKTGVGMMACKKALEDAQGDIEAAIKALREKGLATASKKSDRSTNEGQIFTAVSADKTHGVIIELTCETDFVATNQDFRTLGNAVARAILDAASIQTVEDAQADLKVASKPLQEVLSDAILKLGENITLKKLARLKTPGIVFSYVHMNGKIGDLVAFDSAVSDEIGQDIAMHIAAAAPAYLNPSEVPQSELDSEREIIRNQALNDGKPANIVDKIVEGRIQKYYKEVCLIEQAFVKDPEKSIKAIVPKGSAITQFIRYSF